MPLWAWGGVIMAAGIAGFGIEWKVLGNDHPLIPTPGRWKWGWISNISHITLLAVFLALATSSAYDIAHRGLDGEGWYGWRTTIMWAGYAFANSQYVRRLGPL